MFYRNVARARKFFPDSPCRPEAIRAFGVIEDDSRRFGEPKRQRWTGHSIRSIARHSDQTKASWPIRLERIEVIDQLAQPTGTPAV